MATILEHPEIFSKMKFFSVEEYHSMTHLGNSVELVEGVIFQKIPKSPIHRSIVNNLYDLFFPLKKRGFVVQKEDPLTLETSEPEPDISVILGTNESFKDKHPNTADLIVEVSVTSYELDKIKLKSYANANVKQVWIILPTTKKIEFFTNPITDSYKDLKILSNNDTIIYEGIVIDLQRLF
ncbi:MAG: Uma2 family endonuclease [Leptospiraceae bacterium]|nr:Uma2 family endonuclease [Leptospiraceae bacterium]